MEKETKPDYGKYVMYWHFFSWMLLGLLGKPMPLREVYELSQDWAARDGHMGSWLDVFDGIMWIIAVIGGMIGIGFWLS